MAKKVKKNIEASIEMPEGVTASFQGNEITIKGKAGEEKKRLIKPYIKIEVKGNKVNILAERQTKREKKSIGSFVAHIKNMTKGVTDGHKYMLKICSGHFPMNVAVNGEDFVIKNFLGEKTPRVLKIKKGAKIKVEGEQVIVESTNKEVAGQVAADIELLTKRANYDARIFQDGIYIINKDGKEIK